MNLAEKAKIQKKMQFLRMQKTMQKLPACQFCAVCFEQNLIAQAWEIFRADISPDATMPYGQSLERYIQWTAEVLSRIPSDGMVLAVPDTDLWCQVYISDIEAFLRELWELTMDFTILDIQNKVVYDWENGEASYEFRKRKLE